MGTLEDARMPNLRDKIVEKAEEVAEELKIEEKKGRSKLSDKKKK